LPERSGYIQYMNRTKSSIDAMLKEIKEKREKAMAKDAETRTRLGLPPDPEPALHMKRGEAGIQ
jgi:hypothetical protein